MKSLILLLSYFVLTKAGFTTQEATPIEIIDNKFYNSSSGVQFFIKGVAYQRMRKEGDIFDAEAEPGYIDSLAQPAKCLRDLELLKELGVNTVRVYQIDPTQSHDVCMDAFANHGIYVMADLPEPDLSINRIMPYWDVPLMERYRAVVDCMSKYPNLLGFIAGNEVVNNVGSSDSGAFVRASVRDIKQYIQDTAPRVIPVGYASTDDSRTRMASAQYFTCSPRDESVDFYGINMFEWCGYSSYEMSGYRDRTHEFGRLGVPVFFSEFGCNTESPRPFTEIDSLYGPHMTTVWSGGIVYEFFQHENNYGLVEERAHGKVVKLDDFNIVKLRLLEASPVGSSKPQLTPSYPTQECPGVSSIWNSSSVLPRTPDEGKCQCLEATLSCVITPYWGVDENRLISDVCSEVDCSQILADGSSGQYGNFSDCGPRVRASYALNEYWEKNQRKPEMCDFDRRAILRVPEPDALDASTSDNRTCKVAMGLEAERVPDPEPDTYELSQDAAKLTAKSAAQRPGDFGFAMVLVLMSAFIYLTN